MTTQKTMKQEHKEVRKLVNDFCDKYKLAEIGNITDVWPTKQLIEDVEELHEQLCEFYYPTPFIEAKGHNILEIVEHCYGLLQDNHPFYYDPNPNIVSEEDKAKYQKHYEGEWNHDFIAKYNKNGWKIVRY